MGSSKSKNNKNIDKYSYPNSNLTNSNLTNEDIIKNISELFNSNKSLSNLKLSDKNIIIKDIRKIVNNCCITSKPLTLLSNSQLIHQNTSNNGDRDVIHPLIEEYNRSKHNNHSRKLNENSQEYKLCLQFIPPYARNMVESIEEVRNQQVINSYNMSKQNNTEMHEKCLFHGTRSITGPDGIKQYGFRRDLSTARHRNPCTFFYNFI